MVIEGVQLVFCTWVKVFFIIIRGCENQVR